MEKAIKEIWDKKATGNNEFCGDPLRFLGEYGLQLMAQLFSNICETGECFKDFIEVKMNALKGRPKATKWRDHYTISFIILIQHKL